MRIRARRVDAARLAAAIAVLTIGLVGTGSAGSAAAPSGFDLCNLPPQDWPEELAGPPTLCRSNVFRAPPGVWALRVQVPNVTPIPTVAMSESHIKLRSQGGTFAWFGMSEVNCSIPDRDTCMQAQAYFVPGFDEISYSLVGANDEVRPGLHEIYFLSDGEVTLTLNVDGLSGSMELQATGVVDAELKHLPRNCPATDCENLGYGGLARVNAGKGYSIAAAYGRVPTHVGETGVPNLASTSSVVSCVYPNEIYPDASPDPQDHPQGCDLLPTEEDDDSSTNFIGRTVDPIGTGYLATMGGETEPGAVYTGYAAEQFGPVEPGSYNAWGAWIMPGVTCPSGNWLNC